MEGLIPGYKREMTDEPSGPVSLPYPELEVADDEEEEDEDEEEYWDEEEVEDLEGQIRAMLPMPVDPTSPSPDLTSTPS